jgi:hypothetical protein
MYYSTDLKMGLVVLAAVFLSGCSDSAPVVVSNSRTPGESSAAQGELRLKAPDGWTSERPSSSMRVAQYQLPAAEGDAEAASLVVYYFGAGQGGSTSANIDRWIGQMQPPGGGSSKDNAKTETTTVNGLGVTLLDVSGTYTGGDMGGGSGASKPNFRMRAAVIDTPKGAYFVKLVGPAKTVDRWDQSFREFINSAEFK